MFDDCRAAFCCLFAACTPKNDVNEALKDTLKIEILKIGKADCIIITDGTTSIVVDCGEEDDGADISAAMDALGISSIDYLIITHYDKDHIGGAPTLLKNIKFRSFLSLIILLSTQRHTLICHTEMHWRKRKPTENAEAQKLYPTRLI